MCKEKTLQQAQENMKAVNAAVDAYQNGTMSKEEAGRIVYERLFGESETGQPHHK